MTSNLIGDVYARIIEEVINASSTDFEENGVAPSTLQEMQQEWQQKLSQRAVATMPWDPKPVEPSPASSITLQSSTPNQLPLSASTSHETPPANGILNGPHIKTEPGSEPQFNGMPNGHPQNGAQAQGGLARAQQLVQQQYGQAANASINAMQRGGLALPGQAPQNRMPQGLQLPQQSPPQAQKQYLAVQQNLQQQQTPPNIKIENGVPRPNQTSINQEAGYSQTDGADDALEQWQAMLAERRAVHAQQREHADHLMRDHILQLSSELESGLMVPLDQRPSNMNRKGKAVKARPFNAAASSRTFGMPQLDGDVDDEDTKPSSQYMDDENAINSDLDDSSDDGRGNMGDDDDENGDDILCTYDKVQRVKNKWKCTLKDGVMSVNGKEYVFHKGMGEFEW